MKNRIKIGIVISILIVLVSGILLIEFTLYRKYMLRDLMEILINSGLLFLALVFIKTKKRLISISYFLIILLVLGAIWGVRSTRTSIYYQNATMYHWCQENTEIGNPCKCPNSGDNYCSGNLVGEGILYVVFFKEYAPCYICFEDWEQCYPCSDRQPPIIKNFDMRITTLGKITVLPMIITSSYFYYLHLNNIFGEFSLLVAPFLYMFTGMFIFGFLGWFLDKKVLK